MIQCLLPPPHGTQSSLFDWRPVYLLTFGEESFHFYNFSLSSFPEWSIGLWTHLSGSDFLICNRLNSSCGKQEIQGEPGDEIQIEEATLEPLSTTEVLPARLEPPWNLPEPRSRLGRSAASRSTDEASVRETRDRDPGSCLGQNYPPPPEGEIFREIGLTEEDLKNMQEEEEEDGS